MKQLREDPHTLLSYVTISGTGTRVIAAYIEHPEAGTVSENELHARAFDLINRHYTNLLGYPHDEKCKNVT